MEQLEIFDIPNPCRGICQSNSRGLCLGCFRNRQERFAWQSLAPAQQQNILRLSKQRRQRYLRALRQAQASQQAEKLTGQTELPFD